MQSELAQMQKVRTPHFVCEHLEIKEGGLCMVSVGTTEQGNAFVDTLLGLSPPEAGEVRLFDQAIYEKTESSRLALLAQVGHVGGALISNLMVWENLVLPAAYHGGVSEGEADERLAAVIDALDNPDVWKQGRLAAHPDTLSPLASRIAGLIRSVVSRSRLIVGEFLLNDLEPVPLARIVRMLEWLRSHDPQLGILLVHLGPISEGHFSLNKMGNLGNVILESGTHAIPENH